MLFGTHRHETIEFHIVAKAFLKAHSGFLTSAF